MNHYELQRVHRSLQVLKLNVANRLNSLAGKVILAQQYIKLA